MRFCHRMETKKAQRDYPKLWERFNDKSKRGELFQDFFDSGGDLDTMMYTHTRRHVLSQRSKAKFRPHTKSQLLAKFGQDAAYVELIISDAIAKKRWKKDPLCPNDETRYKYWCLDDETMSFEQLMAIENELQGSIELGEMSAKMLTEDGGYFAMNQAIGSNGFGSNEAARHLEYFAAGTYAAPAKSKGAPTAKPTATAKPPAKPSATGVASGGLPAKASAPAAGRDGHEAPLVPESPSKLAAASAKHLAKISGECTELILKLRFCRASQTLISQLESASKSLQEQHSAVQAFADAKIADPALYEKYREATDNILSYYSDVKVYANALVNCKKKENKDAQE